MDRWRKRAITSITTWNSARLTTSSISPTWAAGQQQSAPASPDGGRTASRDVMENSPLSHLPAELRNIVYGYALYEPDGIPVLVSTGIKLAFGNRKPAFLALSLTCKAIRQEIQGVYCSVNDTIDFRSSNYDLYATNEAPYSPAERLAEIFGVKSRWKILHLRLHVSHLELSLRITWKLDEVSHLYEILGGHFHPEATISLLLDTGFYQNRRGSTTPINVTVDLDRLREANEEVIRIADLARHQLFWWCWLPFALGSSSRVLCRGDIFKIQSDIEWFLWWLDDWLDRRARQ